MRGTTVIGILDRVKKIGVIAGDGQITFGETVLKSKARKVRKIYKDNILAGFAGSTADALTLFEHFEKALEGHRGDIVKAVMELAKLWRSDKILRKLEAMMIVMNTARIFLLSGNGDIIEPDDSIIAIGSGGSYALAAARALKQHTDLSVEEIARNALKIAGEICIYTNMEVSVEKIS